jgi:fibronectin type 3 domain-containing protein
LSWTGSISTNVMGYNVYRAEVAGGAYAKMNASPLATTVYVDGSVASGRTYYYVATTVDNSNLESAYSNLATAVVPTP